MKKFLSAVSIFLCIVMLSASVYAVNVGDIVNHTLHTDIVAYIDGQPIESYNISGYTAIMAEQLMGYGFNVVWNQSSRALYINEGDGNVGTKNVTIPTVTPNMIGKIKSNVYYTDIKTYLNDKLIQSYNIGGYTIIMFEDLAANGKVTWDNATRRIDFRRNSKTESNEISEVFVVPENTTYMKVGESFDVDAIAKYKDGRTESYASKLDMYVSSGDTVVSVKGTKVTALREGSATVRFRNKVGGLENASFGVVVSRDGKAPSVEYLRLDTDTSKSIGVGESFYLTATAYYSNGERKEYTDLDAYIYTGSSTVSLSGNRVKGLKEGTAKIRFYNSFLSGETIYVTVTGNSTTIKSVALDETSVSLTVGSTHTITATATYKNGSEKSYTDINPYISSGSSYISLSGRRITAKSEGTAKIKFEDDYLSGKTLTVYVTSKSNSIKSVSLDKTSVTIDIGESYTIRATATYYNGSEKSYTSFSPYISSGSSYVTLSGKKVTGKKEGTATIKFTDDYLSSKSLKVRVSEDDNDDYNSSIRSVSLKSTSISLAVGNTYTISATATYRNGTTKSYTAFTPYIYSGSSYVKLSGKKLTGKKIGTAKIRFEDDYLSSKTLTVKVVDEEDDTTIKSVTLASTSISLAIGKTYTINPTATYYNGDSATYTDADPYIYSGSSYISLSGRRITAKKAGVAKIKFNDDFLSSKTLTVTVSETGAGTNDVASVEITTPYDKTIAVGDSFVIKATATLGSGKTTAYTDLSPYIYSGEGVISIADNKVTALKVGLAKIKFASEFLTTETIYVDVVKETDSITSITLKTATTQNLKIGESFTIEATAKYKDGTTATFTDLEPYNSDENAVVRIKNNTVTAINEGTCTISFYNEYVTKTIRVTVVDPTANIKSVALDTTSYKLAVGDKQTITATATYTDRTKGEYADADPYITTGSAYISLSDNVITAKKAGTAKIGFRDEWLAGKTITVTVVGTSGDDGTISSVTLDTPTSVTVTPGDSFTIFATAKYRDGTTKNYTDLEPYIYSGDSDAISIDGAKVTAVRAGTAKIRFKSEYLSATRNTITVTVKGDNAYVTEIKLRKTEVTLEVGDTYVIEADSVYYDKKTEAYTGELGARSSNTTVVSVSGNTLTAKKVGKATISFTNDLISERITVTVVAKPEPKPEPKSEEPKQTEDTKKSENTDSGSESGSTESK